MAVMTVAGWKLHIQGNPVFKSMKATMELAGQLADGRRKTAVVSGPSGIGKTSAFEQAFQARGIKYQQPKVASEQALIETLSRYRNGVLLFDDCDEVFRDVGMLNVLKKATDPKSGACILSYETRNRKTRIAPFQVRARLGFLTNIHLNDQRLLSDKKLGPHLLAFKSRTMPYVMSFNHYAIWEYTVYLAIVERMLFHELHANRAVTNEALRYFTETLWLSNDSSPRRLINIAREMMGSPAMWRELLEPSLLPQPWCDQPIPPIPQLPPLAQS